MKKKQRALKNNSLKGLTFEDAVKKMAAGWISTSPVNLGLLTLCTMNSATNTVVMGESG